jgi:hypothetical protein
VLGLVVVFGLVVASEGEYPESMTETADQFEDRDRTEDVERPTGDVGVTEDANPPREGESVEGHGPTT